MGKISSFLKHAYVRSFGTVALFTVFWFIIYFVAAKVFWKDLKFALDTRSGFMLMAAWLTVMVASIFFIVTKINSERLKISTECAEVKNLQCANTFYEIKSQLKIIYITAGLISLFLGWLGMNSILNMNQAAIDETKIGIRKVFLDPVYRPELNGILAERIFQEPEMKGLINNYIAHYYSDPGHMREVIDQINRQSRLNFQGQLDTLYSKVTEQENLINELRKIDDDVEELQKTLNKSVQQQYDLSFSIIYSLRKNKELRNVIYYRSPKPSEEEFSKFLEEVMKSNGN